MCPSSPRTDLVRNHSDHSVAMGGVLAVRLKVQHHVYAATSKLLQHYSHLTQRLYT